jgi:histidine triad (HIT) family protein
LATPLPARVLTSGSERSDPVKDCLFCKFVRGEIAPKKILEDEHVLAFHDINPQAPIHVLVVPKEHVASLADFKPEHAALGGRLLLAAAQVAEKLGARGGYRCVVNTGPDAGQTVHHVHLHVLAGRSLSWPPG